MRREVFYEETYPHPRDGDGRTEELTITKPRTRPKHRTSFALRERTVATCEALDQVSGVQMPKTVLEAIETENAALQAMRDADAEAFDAKRRNPQVSQRKVLATSELNAAERAQAAINARSDTYQLADQLSRTFEASRQIYAESIIGTELALIGAYEQLVEQLRKQLLQAIKKRHPDILSIVWDASEHLARFGPTLGTTTPTRTFSGLAYYFGDPQAVADYVLDKAKSNAKVSLGEVGKADDHKGRTLIQRDAVLEAQYFDFPTGAEVFGHAEDWRPGIYTADQVLETYGRITTEEQQHLITFVKHGRVPRPAVA